MATKIICDRCGADILGEDNELHFTKKRNTRYGYDKLINLCNGCLDSFDKFMSQMVENGK